MRLSVSIDTINKTNETRISLKVIGEIVGRKEIFDCYRISIVETNEK